MSERPDNARAQEPGIGGPVDLAGIARYRKVRSWAVALLALAVVAVMATAGNWLVLPEYSFLPGSLRIGTLAVPGFAIAYLALTVDAGNRTETRLACLGAVWAVAAFTLAAVGAAALLALWVPDAPIWLQATLIVLSGYAVSTPPALGATWLARRRRKRLEAADEVEA